MSVQNPDSAVTLRTALPRFALRIRRHDGGPELRRVPVPQAYLRDFQQELLRDYALRRGIPSATLDDMTIHISPTYKNGECSGVHVDVRNPRGETFRREFNVRVFADVATLALQALIAEGALQLGDNYTYDMIVDESPPVSMEASSPEVSFKMEAKPVPLSFVSRPLKSLTKKARPVSDPSEEHFPVFYTESAFQRAEQCARRGGERHPPLETGAALVGPPCSCPETGEFYLVVTDALAATDAEEEKMSLTYTGKTWVRLQAVVRSIQSQPATRAYRLLGQSHGHNFLPLGGAPPCELCATAKVCSRTSIFVSQDDRTWTQAVFAGAPYALCHIFGFNARQEKVHGLFSLYENRLTERGFYIIPDFDPSNA